MMDKLSELKAILSKQLAWHKFHLDCLAQMLLALMTVRTVNLRELAVAMANKKSLIASREQRLYRFFADFEFDIAAIGICIINLFFRPGMKFYIAIDRTNWFWGKSPINIFMASICYEGIALPFYWKVLKKDGTTSGSEQIELVEKIRQLVGIERIEGLLADREFGNKEFIGYLTASKNERDELMIVVTHKNYKQAISIYLRRWEIECLFQALKGRGFRFEETHMTKPERIERMIAVLTIAFVWAHKIGEWQVIKKPIRLKQLKTFLTTQKRPAYSFFRYGFDAIRDAVTGLTINWSLLKKTFNFLDLTTLGANL